jgi:uncharacterized membrane protein
MATAIKYPPYPSTRKAPAKNGQQSGLMLDTGRFAKGLAWFGIGIGAAEVLVPGIIARLVGTKGHHALIRGYGLREIASGVKILANPKDARPVWARVAGDALDLAALGAALLSNKNRRGKIVCAMAGVATVTALDVLCAQELRVRGGTARATASIILHCPIEDCYRFWRQFENHVRFMPYVESVRSIGPGTYHWIARVPGGRTIEWDTEITKDLMNEQISWHSLNGSGIHYSGSIRFSPAPGGRGTVARVKIGYREPLKGSGIVSKLLGKDHDQVLYKDLRGFKQVMETGEVITTVGQSAGSKNGATWLNSIAR